MRVNMDYQKRRINVEFGTDSFGAALLEATENILKQLEKIESAYYSTVNVLDDEAAVVGEEIIDAREHPPDGELPPLDVATSHTQYKLSELPEDDLDALDDLW